MPIRTRQLLGNNGKTPIPGFYGSSRAGAMLRDAIAKTDSLDVLIIGDSNAGNSATSNNGYTVGFQRVMQLGFRIPNYATPLLSGGVTTPSALTTENSRGDVNGLYSLGISQKWNAHTSK